MLFFAYALRQSGSKNFQSIWLDGLATIGKCRVPPVAHTACNTCHQTGRPKSVLQPARRKHFLCQAFGQTKPSKTSCYSESGCIYHQSIN